MTKLFGTTLTEHDHVKSFIVALLKMLQHSSGLRQKTKSIRIFDAQQTENNIFYLAPCWHFAPGLIINLISGPPI